MITLRPSSARGRFDHGWLDARHTFSFAGYRDPRHMGFGPLRVINEDRVAPGRGFGEHPHADMEIITYVLSGQLAHRDSMGNMFTVGPGEVQRMSAGSGVEHAELNPSRTDPVHLLQIWIMPDARGATPAYDQKAYPVHTQPNTLHLLVSKTGEAGSMSINQDAKVYAATVEAGKSVSVDLGTGRLAWVQVAKGELTLNGTQALSAGDGASLEGEPKIELVAKTASEVLVFDLPR